MEKKKQKAVVDESKCIGCGICSSLCDCFELIDGISHFKSDSGTVCNLEEIAESCPVEAITVEEN